MRRKSDKDGKEDERMRKRKRMIPSEKRGSVNVCSSQTKHH